MFRLVLNVCKWLILNTLYSVKYTESLYKLRLQRPSCEDLCYQSILLFLVFVKRIIKSKA